jgi:hypothetical protein
VVERGIGWILPGFSLNIMHMKTTGIFMDCPGIMISHSLILGVKYCLDAKMIHRYTRGAEVTVLQ